MNRTPLLLAVLLAACDPAPREIAVRVAIPGADSVETAVSGVGVVALPYDRDSLLKAMEAGARTPRPATAVLDTLFADFRGPFQAYVEASGAAKAYGDSVEAATRALAALAPGDAGRAALEQRLARLRPLLADAERRRESARGPLEAARAALRARGDTVRTAVRGWENTTYAGYDSVSKNAALRAGRGFEPQSDTTDVRGWATLKLRPGRWWIYVRAWDALDPNAEWYWNVPLAGDTVRLDATNAVHKAKY